MNLEEQEQALNKAIINQQTAWYQSVLTVDAILLAFQAAGYSLPYKPQEKDDYYILLEELGFGHVQDLSAVSDSLTLEQWYLICIFLSMAIASTLLLMNLAFLVRVRKRLRKKKTANSQKNDENGTQFYISSIVSFVLSMILPVLFFAQLVMLGLSLLGVA